jgi:hypothetical protein
MSGLFDNEDNAAETLLRAGATERALFTAPAGRAAEEIEQVRQVLFHPPRGHDPHINEGPTSPRETVRDRFPTSDEMVYPTHRIPTEAVNDRFPNRREMMHNIDPAPGESGAETLKRELGRLKREREERQRRRRN